MIEVLRGCGIGGNRTYEVGPVIHIVLGQKQTEAELATRLGISALPKVLTGICGKPETALLIDRQQSGSTDLETWSISPDSCFQICADERFVRWEERLPIGAVTIDNKEVPVYQANSAPDESDSHQ